MWVKPSGPESDRIVWPSHYPKLEAFIQCSVYRQFLLLQLPLKLYQLAQDILLSESRQMLQPEAYQVRPHNTPSLWILSATPLENTKDQERRREGSNRGRPQLHLSTAIGQTYLTQSPITKISIHRLQQLESTGFKSPPSHQPWEPGASQVLMHKPVTRRASYNADCDLLGPGGAQASAFLTEPQMMLRGMT